ncbi:hypothetical protein [Xylophilus ampelinus]|uniref:hypothetical protein n=1 Tax=Xylophilus ampelinus TaxID=54067 RepID=UPI000D7C0196|nr:hypothetical protein [Xylophilus ampelinus]MCS4510431.1 hypothetical protein [Xylophilus ampelinus]
MQATLDQFLACIEDSDPAQRPVALVDFLLATTTLAHQIQRGGTPLSALQLLAMQAVTEAGIDDAADPKFEAEAEVNSNSRAPGQAAQPHDPNVWRAPAAEGGEAACLQAFGTPAAPFGLAEVKALLVNRMEAVRRAQMLAGADTGQHHQAVDSMRFAMLPLLVLNAHRPRPPLQRRIAADRTELIQAGLALARDGQAPGTISRNRVVPETGQPTQGLHVQPDNTLGNTDQTGHKEDRGDTGDP